VTKTYEVTVSNYFDAESPKDAVGQMITWLIDNADVAGYRVTCVTDTWFIDAEEIEAS
jgi:hypothetical protein